MDTIDFSNLNRQFLFRKKHVGMSKAQVATEAALELVPEAKINPHFSNIIKDPKFDLAFFEQFDMVMNALDNLEARSHVNVMCLATGIPLVESGTAGLLGQATVHVPGKTECFDCSPRSAPTTFPVCTIRSTPSKPIHCIVWAKMYLFGKLFGVDDEDETNNAVTADDDLEEIKKLKEEERELKVLRENSDKKDYAEKIFEKVYSTDIKRLLMNEETWKNRDKPSPLDLKQLNKPGTAIPQGLDKTHKLWTLEQAVSVFLTNCSKLGKRVVKVESMEFDKDDDEIMEFVAAAAYLRMHVFNIEKKTLFESKEMAGNIIPAIATTNAIIAALMVIMAKKLINGDWESIKTTYLSYNTPPKILNPVSLVKPNDFCAKCAVAYRKLFVDSKKFTLKDVLNEIVREKYGLEGELSVFNSVGSLIYDPDFEDMEDTKLADLNLIHGSKMVIETDSDEPGGKKVPLVLFIIKEENSIRTEGDMKIPVAKVKPVVQEAENDNSENVSKKRKAEDDGESSASVKKSKSDVIVLDEENDTIVLD